MLASCDVRPCESSVYDAARKGLFILNGFPEDVVGGLSRPHTDYPCARGYEDVSGFLAI